MKKFVIRIGGGLGNQLFQCAHVKFLSQETGYPFVIDRGEIALGFVYCFKYRRRYGLNDFIGPSQENKLSPFRQLFFLLLWIARKLLPSQKSSKLFSLLGIAVSNIVDGQLAVTVLPNHSKPIKTILCSGCQNYLNIIPNRNFLRQYFAFKHDPAPKIKAILNTIDDGNLWCSVHIRRSDYLTFNGALSQSYYVKAIKIVKQKIPLVKLIFFSDDIEWCRQNLTYAPDAIFFEGNYQNPTDDLRIMTHCRHHILANSTFSWWGAFLGMPGGTTIYPTEWHKDPQYHIPKDWIPVPSNP